MMPFVLKWHARNLAGIYLAWGMVCFGFPAVQLARDYVRVGAGAKYALNPSHRVDGIPVPDILFGSINMLSNPWAVFGILGLYFSWVIIKKLKRKADRDSDRRSVSPKATANA
ncbi:MAG: hypothetical protein AB7F43_09385 [Bacteriovoracia bacterium]